MRERRRALGIAFAISGLQPIAIPLPSLLPQAGPNCVLLAYPDVHELLLPIAGSARSTLTIPDSPSLAGASFHHQFLAFEFATPWPPSLITSSNALQLVVGAY